MKRKTPPDFDTHYHSLLGERWNALRAYATEDGVHAAVSLDEGEPYFLDEASVCAAEALEVQPGDSVLDMCAAPGGKSLVILRALAGRGRLIANDRSASRRRRLRRVLESRLPEERRDMVVITSHDATRWGLYEQGVYDKVLLDAPCSSERHVLASPEHLKKWSPSRSRRLSVQAFAMLAAALEAVKPGGRIVYSTCAYSPLENDDVIHKLKKKRAGRFVIERPDAIPEYAEATDFGYTIWPDTAAGRGPIFFCRIRRSE